MIVSKTNVKNIISLLLILTALVGIWETQAKAASAANFYKEKKILLMSADKAGGGTDLIVRIIAPYLKKYTEAYAVIIENVVEAGGMLALNRLWNAKPDGLILSTNPVNGVIMMEVSKQEGIQFQGDKFNVIYAVTSEIGQVLMVNAKGAFHSIDDLKKAKGLKSAAPFGRAVSAAFFTDVLGLDAKITPGITTGDVRMALLRGEIDFATETIGGALEGIKSGAMQPLCVALSTAIPVLPQAPPVAKFASLSPQQKEWSRIFELTDSGKYVFAGPNVPKERIEYLRNVYEKIHKDPQFLKDRKKFERWPGGEPWLNGTDAQKAYTASRGNTIKGYSSMVEYLSKKYYTVK